ncbi:trypsin-like peptidase domain-containing protein [Streptomyces sp. C11-1]|uniref:Trypsin-like peptidase domain-containing protein n=1 Tax=Streptomyces durocortorensis TaxID=2811104 RepID=A0ABY9W3X6_9ACTN|nr:trypsin-like peptidase domain-containing protein [Streptomyces durocortorensis]WNF29575.1 trypsin-like peptidase domain-containing protein [Streptomyces durocortorensis]
MRSDPRNGGGGLDPHRLAEIIVRTGSGRRRGSGYRISAGVVLTAAHVVADATEVVVRCDADRPGEWSVPAAVAWADGSSDLAVLNLTSPAALPVDADIAPARFGRIADDRHGVFVVHAAGFPLWKRRRRPDGTYFRELHQADGTVAALSNLRTGTLEMTVAPAGADPDPDVSPWAGMSGAAVWAGSRIVGVVAEHHRWEGTGRLTAVRLDRAVRQLAAPDRVEFARLTGFPATADLPFAVPGESVEPPGDGDPDPEVRVVGVPVAHGIELFKNRTHETDLIAGHLSDPANRMVTVIGRRGIGKSALAAKVMDLLDRGTWPGTVRGPVPSGLVNLSTRTTGISLERLFFDCARLLGPEREARLREVWSTGGTVHDRLDQLHAAMGGRLIVILLDNLEDLLHDDGGIADEGLAVFLDWLFRTRGTPRLLVTSQLPVRLAPELRRFTAQVELSKGLGSAEAAALLRELDRDGSLGIADLSDDELLNAAVRVHGVPRALELLVGAVAGDTLLLPTLSDVLKDFTHRHDVVADLAQDRYRRLDEQARAVLGVLAALRIPVKQAAVEEILAGLDPSLPVTPALTSLVRTHLVSVDRPSRTLALHPMDADLAYAQMPSHGSLGRQTVERRLAAWYAGQRRPDDAWRSPEDLEPHRRQFEHLVRADDHDAAARVLNEISEWLVWHGSVLSAVSMHLTVRGHIGDDRVRLAHTVAYGHARLSAGPMEQAVDLFTEAVELAERLGDRSALQNALFGLGDAHRQIGNLGTTVELLTRAAGLAGELGDTEREAHALLSLSLTHSYLGDGERALDGADWLAAIADASGDPLTTARAGNARTIALLTLGRWQDTIAAGAETARAYRASGTPEAIAYALNAQGIAFLALDAPAQGIPVLEEACHEASLMENPRGEGVCLLNLAWAYWCDGRHGQSAGTAERASTVLRIAGSAQEEAARSLAEAARARPLAPRKAAAALNRAAASLDGNAEVIAPAWLTEHADRLADGAAPAAGPQPEA